MYTYTCMRTVYKPVGSSCLLYILSRSLYSLMPSSFLVFHVCNCDCVSFKRALTFSSVDCVAIWLLSLLNELLHCFSSYIDCENTIFHKINVREILRRQSKILIFFFTENEQIGSLKVEKVSALRNLLTTYEGNKLITLKKNSTFCTFFFPCKLNIDFDVFYTRFLWYVVVN